MLRALGARLEEEEPARFSLLEVPDGFTVISQSGTGQPVLREVHHSGRDLMEHAMSLMRARKFMGSKKSGAWKYYPTGRQDFLRSLGYELDDSLAEGLLLDELDDGVLVTYSFLDPTHGYGWRKRVLTLNPEEIEIIVRAGHERRQRRGFLR